jgi:hypothetical protein
MSAPPPGRSQKKTPPSRSLGSRVKLWIGCVGSLLCALWWPLLVIMLFLPDPAPEGLNFNSHLTILTVSVLLTVLFLVILRSGLRGPADPLAPDESKVFEPKPLLPPAPDGLPDAPPPSPQKKRHLRLVRPVR